MGYHEDQVRARMERETDIARGLGMTPGLDDLRAYGNQLDWAAVMDAEDCSAELYKAELDFYREMGLPVDEANARAAEEGKTS